MIVGARRYAGSNSETVDLLGFSHSTVYLEQPSSTMLLPEVSRGSLGNEQWWKDFLSHHECKRVLLPLTKCNESLAVYYVHLYAVAAGAQFFFDGGGWPQSNLVPSLHPPLLRDRSLAGPFARLPASPRLTPSRSRLRQLPSATPPESRRFLLLPVNWVLGCPKPTLLEANWSLKL